MPPNSDFGDISSNSTIRGLSFYDILEVTPQSSQSEIRDAYRRKSKQYHPDTTLIDKQEAARRFRSLKRAYETLRFPDKRQQYDALLAQKRVRHQMRSPAARVSSPMRSSASLDPEDRALSAGEMFALFILGLTFLFCLLVAIFIGISRGEMIVQSIPQDSSLLHQIKSIKSKPELTKKSPNGSDHSQPTLNRAKNSDKVEIPPEAFNPRFNRSLFPPATPR